MLCLGAKLFIISAFSPLIIVRRHFQTINIATLPTRPKPYCAIKFLEWQLTDVRESKMRDEKKKHSQNTAPHSQSGQCSEWDDKIC